MAAARRSSILVMGFKKPGVSRLTLGFDGQTPVLAACWQLIFYIVPRGLKQVKVWLYNSRIKMDIDVLENKLRKLRVQLQRLETEEAEKIRRKRMLADMGDDFRENEGAKMVMEDHNLLHMRIFKLKKEIYEIKKALAAARGYNP